MATLPLDSPVFRRFHSVASSFPGDRIDALRSMEKWEDVDAGCCVADVWFDSDSNRVYDVMYVRGEPLPSLDDEEDESDFFDNQDEEETLAIRALLCDVVDDLPHGTFAFTLTHCGEVLWTSSDPKWNGQYDVQQGYKPSLHQYHLPRPLPTLLRSQLTLVDRLYRFVDKVTYPPSPWDQQGKTAVFKYPNPYMIVWREIQTLARLPAHHPHMIGIDCIILEELTGLGVIGFTTRFIDAPTMDRWPPSRPFKLRYLQELMGVLDELHLQYGVHHRDLADRNLMVDPDTDKLVVIDFGLAAPPNHGGYHSEWNDFKAMVAFLHHRITWGVKYDGESLPDDDEEASLLLSRERWVKHPDVVLDHGADVFYDELVAWTKKRGRWHEIQPAQPAPASQLPPPPTPPPPFQIHTPFWPTDHLIQLKDEVCLDDSGFINDLCQETGQCRRSFGRPALTWHRPPSSKVDPTRRLLATGRYADEEEAVSGKAIAVPDPKLGFPQPPVFPPTPAARPNKRWNRKRASGSARLVSEDI